MYELLRTQVMSLEEGPREVLLLHYFSGKGVREIGEVLDISTEAVKKRLQRARDLLSSKVMEQLGGALERECPAPNRPAQIMAALATVSPGRRTGARSDCSLRKWPSSSLNRPGYRKRKGQDAFAVHYPESS